MSETKVCPSCGAALDLLLGKCSYCGYQFLLDEAELSKYSIEVRARHYRKNEQYELAIRAYHEWLRAQPTNSEAWIEYLEFLYEYCQKYNFYNRSQIAEAFCNVLFFCQKHNYFQRFSDQARLVACVYKLLESVTYANYSVSIFEKYGNNLSINFYSMIEAQVLQPVEQDEKTNFYVMKYLQLYTTVFLDDSYAEQLLACVLPNEKSMYGDPQLMSLLMVEDVLRRKKTRALNKEVPGRADEFDRVLVPLFVGIVRIGVLLVCVAAALLFAIIGLFSNNLYFSIFGMLFLITSILEYVIYYFKPALRLVIRVVGVISGLLLFALPAIPFAIFWLVDYFAYERSKILDTRHAQQQWELYKDVDWLASAYCKGSVDRADVFERLKP